VPGDDKILDQVRKQLNRLVDVHECEDFSMEDHGIVNRELVLIKVTAHPGKRSEILEVVNVFRARINDIGPENIIVEATGDEGKIKALLNLLSPYGILEVARGGRVAMRRGISDTEPVVTAVI
jgi:acetolactate synthase-1/3 small subunit